MTPSQFLWMALLVSAISYFAMQQFLMYLSLVQSLVLGLFAGPVQGHFNQSFESKCTALASHVNISTGHAFSVQIAEYLPAGSIIDHTAEALDATCNTTTAPPVPVNLCRLALDVATSNQSGVILETWLPEAWEGRFLSTGNGGMAGCVPYPDIAYAASQGFAVVGTNNGHNGTSGGSFYHQPDVLEDFVWRALYTGVVVGKEITTQFYRKKASKSYYIGCSTGGRQGWKAVQSYPELFDGVVVGAPAFRWNGLFEFFPAVVQTLGWDNSSDTFLAVEQWTTLQEESLKQCDHLDGATDGILEDTRQCHVDWTPLHCATNNRTGCLSAAQVAAVHKLFSPFLVDNHVENASPAHGYELLLAEALYAPLVITWMQDWYRYVVKQDLSWKPTDFTPDDARAARQLNPFNIQTFDADLSAFRDKGGKVLHWHGQADPLLSVSNSDTYYDRVSATLNASSAELDAFYRYFRVSGVNHCLGGPGANYLGQVGYPSVSYEPEDNMLARIVDWVEKGNAPEFVRGTKFVGDDPGAGVAFTRKHCKHPAVNVYVGTGNGTDEQGWKCVER